MLSRFRDLHRGWLMVAAGVVIIAAAVGLVGNCYSLFIVPVCEELGFLRSQMSANQTILGMGMMLVSLLWGPVFSKLRLRRVMCISAAATCACYFLNAFANNIIAFYFISAALSVSTALLSWSPFTVIIGNWFNEKRGLAIGVAFMGSGVGGMIFNALGGVLINIVGWRQTFMIFAVIMTLIMLPTVLFVVKIKPEDVGLKPYGDHSAHGRPLSAQGMSLSNALNGRQMYMLLGCFLLLGFCLNSMNLTTAPNMRALGYSAVYSANVASAYMASLALAKIALGAMCDRLGVWRGCAISLIALLAASVCAMFARNIAVVALFVIANGLGTAFGSVAYPLISRDLYGERDQAAISGVFNSIGSLGGAFGPTICGMVYDMTGAYTPAFAVMAAITVSLGTTVVAIIARGSGRWKFQN